MNIPTVLKGRNGMPGVLLVFLLPLGCTQPSEEFSQQESPIQKRSGLVSSESSGYVAYSVVLNEEEQNRMEMLLEDLENVDMFCLHSPDQFYKYYFEWPGVETADSTVSAIYWGKFHLGGSIELGFLPVSLNSLWLNDNDLHGVLDTWLLPRSLRSLTIENNRFEGTISWKMLPDSMTFLNIQNNMFHGELFVSLLPESMENVYISKNLFSCIHLTDRSIEILGQEEYLVLKDKSEELAEGLVSESALTMAERSKPAEKHSRQRKLRGFCGIPALKKKNSVHKTMQAISKSPYIEPRKKERAHDLSEDCSTKSSHKPHSFIMLSLAGMCFIVLLIALCM